MRTGLERGGRIWRRALVPFLALAAASWAVPLAAELFVADGSAVRVYADGASGDTPPLRSLELFEESTVLVVALDPTAGELFVGTVCPSCGPVILPSITTPRIAGRAEAGCTSAVGVFDLEASGPVTPAMLKRMICGPATGIEDPVGLVVDAAAGELFVIDNEGAILVFPLAADGDVAPLRTVSGPSTGLASPRYGFLDRMHGELFVSTGNILDAAVRVFDSSADGDVAPLRTLSGVSTLIGLPNGLSVNLATDELFVADGVGAILTFSRDADGDTPPLRRVSGPGSGLQQPFGLTATGSLLIVADPMAAEVLSFPTMADGNAAPADRLGGVASQLVAPFSLASTLAVDSGTFAVSADAALPVEIPTLSEVGAGLLVLMLSAAGLWLHRRRDPRTGRSVA